MKRSDEEIKGEDLSSSSSYCDFEVHDKSYILKTVMYMENEDFVDNFVFNSSNDGNGFLGSVTKFVCIYNLGVKLCGVAASSLVRKLAFSTERKIKDAWSRHFRAVAPHMVAYHMFQGTSARLLWNKNIEKSMDWFYTKRRGPVWKQGWSGQTLASLSAPPLPLLAIFGIVLLLLWLSQYTGYKAEMQLTTINFQLFIFLLPIMLIFLMASLSSNGGYSFRIPRLPHGSMHQAGGTPWGIAILVVVLLVLISYQSSFHSKWFGGS
ncbi:hypothetical protein Q3G72_033178 [Acer saccharum]|nr:hypothetical protein Q3G72_033178 [Acer saccharum]